MTKDLVSVTLVTYNSGRFIKRCLESVLEQKYPNLEIIVIDNASSNSFRTPAAFTTTPKTPASLARRTRRSRFRVASGCWR
jgi:GT2 family glycosyltransferase